MSISTDGQLCYGVAFEEDYEFPWDEDELGEWWRKVNDCPIESPYNESGVYKSGVTNAGDYFIQRDKWDIDNPLPITLVNCCSGDCPMWILAVPGSFLHCSRGYPLAFNLGQLSVNGAEVQRLLDFCKRFSIKPISLNWLLSSYWG